MSKHQYEAIIFDCFGVLVTDGWLPFKRKHFGNSAEKLERATELNHMVDNGLISYEDFVRQIAELAEVTYEEFDTVRNAVTDEMMIALVKQLKPHYKIGMLSNVAGDWLDTMFPEKDLQLFDAVALSYEMGVSKPDERAYEIIAGRLDVSPDQCVFIDDQEHYVAAAQAQGMQGIWYQDLLQLQADLAGLGIPLGKKA